MRKILVAAALVLMMSAQPAYSVITVKEVGVNLLQNILQAVRNLISNNNEYTMIDDLVYIQGELEGVYGWGDEYMDDGSKKDRRWTPAEFYELLQMYGSGSAPDARLEEIMGHFEQMFPIYSEDQYNTTRSTQGERKAKYAAALERSIGSSSAVALRSSERVRDSLDKMESLSEKIEDALNQKSSQDITGRIMIQVGLAVAELTTLIAQQAEGDASSQRGAVEARKAHADFLKVEGLGE